MWSLLHVSHHHREGAPVACWLTAGDRRGGSQSQLVGAQSGSRRTALKQRRTSLSTSLNTVHCKLGARHSAVHGMASSWAWWETVGAPSRQPRSGLGGGADGLFQQSYLGDQRMMWFWCVIWLEDAERGSNKPSRGTAWRGFLRSRCHYARGIETGSDLLPRPSNYSAQAISWLDTTRLQCSPHSHAAASCRGHCGFILYP